ncbi:MAG: hypothetical protein ACRDRW_04930 [Pseudonocardiaceae bacterium]
MPPTPDQTPDHGLAERIHAARNQLTALAEDAQPCEDIASGDVFYVDGCRAQRPGAQE